MEFLWEFFKNFDQNTSGIMLGIQFGSGLTGTLGLTYVSRYSIWDGTDGHTQLSDKNEKWWIEVDIEARVRVPRA